MAAITVEVSILSSDGMCAIPVPFDPKAEFGKVRAPVEVTLNGYLVKALKAKAGLWKRWGELSYTTRRECVGSIVGAKKPETRERRIAKVVQLVRERAGPRK